MNEYQKTFDMCLKIFIYGCVALWFLGFLKFLPDDISNKIVNGLLGKFLPGQDDMSEERIYNMVCGLIIIAGITAIICYLIFK